MRPALRLLASFSSDFSGVAVVDIVSQIGPQVVDVGEGSWPCAIESGTNRLAEQEVEVVDQRLIVGEVLRRFFEFSAAPVQSCSWL